MKAPLRPQVLLFEVNGQRVGMLLAEVGRLLPEGELLPIPMAHPAMAGVLDDLEEDMTVPVFDLQAYLWPDLGTQKAGSAGSVAVFPTPLGQAGIRIEKQLGTRDRYDFLPSEEISKWVESMPAHARGVFSTLAQAEDGAFFFFLPDNFWLQLDLEAPAKPENLPQAGGILS